MVELETKIYLSQAHFRSLELANYRGANTNHSLNRLRMARNARRNLEVIPVVEEILEFLIRKTLSEGGLAWPSSVAVVSSLAASRTSSSDQEDPVEFEEMHRSRMLLLPLSASAP